MLDLEFIKKIIDWHQALYSNDKQEIPSCFVKNKLLFGTTIFGGFQIFFFLLLVMLSNYL
jgi:hypothetical protein